MVYLCVIHKNTVCNGMVTRNLVGYYCKILTAH